MDHITDELYHLWFALFPSNERLQAYFAEGLQLAEYLSVFSSDNEQKAPTEDEPLNDFAKEQGIDWYDHDFVEYDYFDNGISQRPVELLPFDQDVLNVVKARLTANEMLKANTYILGKFNDLHAPKSIINQDYQLWYIGQFQIDFS